MRFFFIVVLFLIPWAGMAQTHGGDAKDEPRVPVDLPAEQQSKMGLQFSPVEKKALEPALRTVGTITIDQRLEAHVHTPG